MPNANFSTLITLARPLCPCTERTAARGSGTLAPGAVILAIRYTADNRYLLRVECPLCGASAEVDWRALNVVVTAPPPGAGTFTFKATQAPGRA